MDITTLVSAAGAALRVLGIDANEAVHHHTSIEESEFQRRTEQAERDRSPAPPRLATKSRAQALVDILVEAGLVKVDAALKGKGGN